MNNKVLIGNRQICNLQSAICNRFGFFLLVTVFCSGVLFAQGENGTIVGIVADTSGAAVPGALVVIKNDETGATVTVMTNETGQYASPPLRPGSYAVSAEMSGFRRTVQTIRLDVNQHARINFELAVGSVAESVSVTAETPLLETQSAALGNVRTTRAINDLPLNGRNFVQLFHIATGVIPVGGGPTLGPSASNQMGVVGGSVNGARPSNNDFRFDGIQSQDTDQNVLVLIPSADAIQEFKVQTNAMDASFGRNGGGTVNLVMKSGANHLHGTLFEFLRNSALDAKNFFDSPTGKTPPFNRNILEGPGTKIFDFSLFKDFSMGVREGHRLQFRAEFFNIFNTPQFNTPNASIGSPGEGQISGAGELTFFQRTSRQIQFAFKYYF